MAVKYLFNKVRSAFMLLGIFSFADILFVLSMCIYGTVFVCSLINKDHTDSFCTSLESYLFSTFTAPAYSIFLKCNQYEEWKGNTWALKYILWHNCGTTVYPTGHHIKCSRCWVWKGAPWCSVVGPTFLDDYAHVSSIGERKSDGSLFLRSLDWFTFSDFNWLYNRFPYVPHIGSRFTRLERSQSTIWFWQGKSGICFRDVGVWTLLCSCADTTGQQATICFWGCLQRKIFLSVFWKLWIYFIFGL